MTGCHSDYVAPRIRSAHGSHGAEFDTLASLGVPDLHELVDDRQ